MKKNPWWLWITLILTFLIGLSSISSGFSCYFSKDMWAYKDETFLIGTLTFGFIAMASAVSYGITFWQREKHREQEKIEQNKLANIEYLNAQREDIDRLIKYLVDSEIEYVKPNHWKSNLYENLTISNGIMDFDKRPKVDVEVNDHIPIRNNAYKRQINYLYEIKSKIFNYMSKILDDRKDNLTFLETLKIRTNTKRDYLDILEIENNIDDENWRNDHKLWLSLKEISEIKIWIKNIDKDNYL